MSGTVCPLQQMLASEVLHSLHTLHLPQSWLASRCGLSQKHVSQMLTGKVEGSITAWDRMLTELGHAIQDRTHPESA